MNAHSSLRGFALALLLLAGLPAATPAPAQGASTPTPAPEVVTLAGPNYGLDGTGEAASFNELNDVAFGRDSAGDFVLVVDNESHTVRRFDLATRLVTTLAGLAGRPGSSDGFGAVARFTRPEGLAISANGSFALVIDANGVRRITLATGEVRTLSPLGGGRSDVAIAPDNSYALISASNGISRLSLSDNSVTPLANLGQYYTINTNLAIAPDGTFALVSVYFSHVILRVDTSTGAVTELAGVKDTPGSADGVGSAARFKIPAGLTISADGQFALVTDDYRRIRRIALGTGTVTTLTYTSGSPSWNLDGIALDPSASFAMVADFQGNRLLRVDLAAAGTQPSSISPVAGNSLNGFADGTGTVVRFVNPVGISLSSDETYALIADVGNGLRRLEVVDGERAAGTVTTLVPTQFPDNPNDIVISRDGSFALYTTRYAVRRLDLSVNPPTVSILAGGNSGGTSDGVGAAARFQLAGGLGLSPDESFALVTDIGANSLRRVDLATRLVSTIADAADGFTFDHGPGFSDVAVVNGYGLVADTGNQVLRKVDLATGAVTIVAGALGEKETSDGVGTAARFHTPSAIAVSEDGRYALVTQFVQLRRVSLDTFEVSTPLSTDLSLFADGFSLELPRGVAISRSGSFALISDSGNYAVRRMGVPVLADGRVTTLAGEPGQTTTVDGTGRAARFTAPSGTAVSDSGIALIADTTSHTIRHVVVPNGAVTTFAGKPGEPGTADGTGGAQGLARLNQPVGVAIDRLATFGLVADSGNHTIRRINLRSGLVSTPAGLAATPGGANGAGPAARFNQPLGIALACGAGPLTQATPATDCPFALVADTNNHAIRKLSFDANGLATVTTIAGALGQSGNLDAPGEQARFNRPTSIAVSRGGAFALIVDEDNAAIRKLDLATNVVSTLPTPLTPASPGLAQGGTVDFPLVMVALPCGADEALLLDRGANTLSRLSLDDGTVELAAGLPGESGSRDGVGTAARFKAPGGLGASCYAENGVVVGDTGNGTLRPVDLFATPLSLGLRTYLPLMRR